MRRLGQFDFSVFDSLNTLDAVDAASSFDAGAFDIAPIDYSSFIDPVDYTQFDTATIDPSVADAYALPDIGTPASQPLPAVSDTSQVISLSDYEAAIAADDAAIGEAAAAAGVSVSDVSGAVKIAAPVAAAAVQTASGGARMTSTTAAQTSASLARSVADILKTGAQVFMPGTQAASLLTRLNTGTNAGRYVTRTDASGRTVVIDTMTGRPVGVNASGMPVFSQTGILDTIKRNPLLVLVGGGLLIFLLRR